MTISPHLKQLVPMVAVAAALGAMAWVVTSHFDDHSAHSEVPITGTASANVEAASPAAADNSTTVTAVMWKQMSSWHLFGKFTPAVADVPAIEIAAEEEPAEPDLSNIPETRIPLKLSGIAYSSDQRKAFAMVITPDGHQAEYQAGESIGTEATVHLIEERRVVINRDGKFEALSLPETAEALRNTTRTVRTRAPRELKRPPPNQKKILIDNEQNESDPEA